MNEFLTMLILSAGGLAALYWKLSATNMDIPPEAEKIVEGAESWLDTCETQNIIRVILN